MAEWKRRGYASVAQGIYFPTSGLFFVVLYAMCLLGMKRGDLLRIPCYRLMFFNGLIDILDIAAVSFFPAYFYFEGSVLCSSPVLGWIAGHFAWSVWCGASFNCVVLALNRVVEMIPALQRFRFLFKGRLLKMWMLLSVLYMVVRPFVSRSHPFNTAVSAYISVPMISDDDDWEKSYYSSLLFGIHSIIIFVVLILLYVILCSYVFKFGHIGRGTIDKVQIQLFLQALCICATTAMASLLYALIQFFSVPRSVVIGANVVWQFSHGLHGIVYMCFNSTIHIEVLRMLRFTTKHTATTGILS